MSSARLAASRWPRASRSLRSEGRRRSGYRPRGAFRDSYAILGAQRAAKIIGIFTRLSWRDGKQQYLRHIPRVWRLLEAGLEQPVLAPVKEWFDAEVPAAERVTPPKGDKA